MRIAALTRPLPGESHNGDAFFLARLGQDMTLKDLAVSNPEEPESSSTPAVIELDENDVALLAVVDGVGHGPEAAATTTKILDCLRKHYRLDPVSLVRECHQATAHSRGATVGFVLFRLPDSQIHYIGVGDVKMQIAVWNNKQTGREASASLIPSRHPGMSVQTLVNNNGTIGYGIPERLQTTRCEYSPGAIILMSSDGIGKELNLANVEQVDVLEVEAVSELLVSGFALDRDDATVVVAR